MKELKVLIVGQGIAGSSLAFCLLEKGANVTLIDDGFKSSSSLVAAGMWNPLSFKKLTTGWRSSEFVKAAYEFYGKTEQLLGLSFFHTKPLYRIFADQHQANEWDEKSDRMDIREFVRSNFTQKLNHVKAPFGFGVVDVAGWCDIPLYLKTARKYFQEKNILIENRIKFEDIEVDSERAFYRAEEYDYMVFATGWKNNENPFFKHIEIHPNKGQVLQIKLKNAHIEPMLNYGNFLLPMGDDTYKVGATYEFNDPNPLPTEETKQKTLEKLKAVVESEIEVIEHLAGYRPTIPSRKPIVTAHPEFKKLYIFNGFGSKGVLYVPLHAMQLSDALSQ